MFQTSASNSQTNISIVPSGSSVSSTFTLEGDSATSSGATVGLLNNAGSNGEARLFSDRRGSSATYLPLTFYTGGSERVRIDTSGNVGIGVTPSASTLPTIQSQYGVLTGNDQLNIATNAYFGSAWKYTATAAAARYLQFNGAHQWYSAGSGAANAAISFTNTMTLSAAGVLTIGSAISLDPTTANALVVNSSGYIQLGTTTVRGRLHSVNAGFNPDTSAWATGAAFTSSGSFGGAYAIIDGSAGFGLYAVDSGATLLIGQGATSGGLTQKVRITAAGDVLVTGGGGLGYGTGSGGTVTQATSKSTTVTLNKTTGQITMNNAALAAGASVQFNFNNNTITATDTIIVNVNLSGVSVAGNYSVRPCITSGVAQITLKNESGGSLSEAVVLNFAVIKGATS
jgi:hypothetical protein